MSTRSFICIIALLLASTLAGLSLSGRAEAAYNQNNARSNHAKAGVAESGEGEALIDNMRTRIDQLEAHLKSLGMLSAQIDEELAAIDALQAEINSLSEQAAAQQESDAASADEQQGQIDEALRVFNEQVAPLLDSDVSQAVLSALDAASKDAAKMRGGVHVAAGDVNGDGIAEMSTSIDEIKDAAAELKKVVEKATSGLKDTLKTQV